MTHYNRGRLTVDPNGNWRLYTNTIPTNSIAIGTITRGDSDTGALIQIKATGAYVQVNAGAIRTLDAKKVSAALGVERKHGLTGRPGNALKGARPRSGRIQIRVDADVESKARKSAEKAGVSLPDYISALILLDSIGS